MCDKAIEFPRINYLRCNTQPYAYVYGIHASKTHDYFDSLIKITIETGEHLLWQEPGCYTSEPVFIAKPDSQTEDDGLIASMILDTNNKTTFLLLLDATTFEEVGRAIVPTMLPFSMHGNYFAKDVEI